MLPTGKDRDAAETSLSSKAFGWLDCILNRFLAHLGTNLSVLRTLEVYLICKYDDNPTKLPWALLIITCSLGNKTEQRLDVKAWVKPCSTSLYSMTWSIHKCKKPPIEIMTSVIVQY